MKKQQIVNDARTKGLEGSLRNGGTLNGNGLSMKPNGKHHTNGNGNGHSNGVAKTSQIMTLKEVAKYLGLHVMTVYKLTRQGHIPSAKIGGQWRFKQDVLDAWLDSQMRQPHGTP